MKPVEKTHTSNAFIFHGAYGNPKENWFPWLKKELEKMGISTSVPTFPTPEGQNLENWLEVFETFKNELNPGTIIIGHSIACAFILNILENLRSPIKTSYLVAPFIRGLNSDEVDKINESFYDHSFEWEQIKKSCDNFFCFISDNDPYVPLLQAKEVADGLGVNLNIVKGAGHFNMKAGYSKFPLLLESIKKIAREDK